MAKKMSTKELMFYKEYHNNPINKLIHVICIPLIAVTLGNLCTYLIPVNALSGFLTWLYKSFFLLIKFSSYLL